MRRLAVTSQPTAIRPKILPRTVCMQVAEKIYKMSSPFSRLTNSLYDSRMKPNKNIRVPLWNFVQKNIARITLRQQQKKCGQPPQSNTYTQIYKQEKVYYFNFTPAMMPVGPPCSRLFMRRGVDALTSSMIVMATDGSGVRCNIRPEVRQRINVYRLKFFYRTG